MLLNIENLPMVAMDFMNNVHKEDVEIINSLYEKVLEFEKSSSEENFQNVVTKYSEWFEHTVAHFKGEEEKMLELRFPPYMMHKGEHDNVLVRMEEVIRVFRDTRDTNSLKEYFEDELPNWLNNHIQTMDTVTAMFFKTGLSPCAMH